MYGEKMSRGRGSEFLGKIVVSEESGRKFGIVGDIDFVAESGELLNIILTDPTRHATQLSLEQKDGRLLIPFSTVKSVGDFVIISEKDII